MRWPILVDIHTIHWTITRSIWTAGRCEDKGNFHRGVLRGNDETLITTLCLNGYMSPKDAYTRGILNDSGGLLSRQLLRPSTSAAWKGWTSDRHFASIRYTVSTISILDIDPRTNYARAEIPWNFTKAGYMDAYAATTNNTKKMSWNDYPLQLFNQW